MKVLFICYANVGRSQVAQAYFKTLSQHDCDSAGIAVNERIALRKLPSKKLKDNPSQYSVEYIRREFGIDIAEKEVVFWDIPDPAGQPDDFAYDIYREVQRRVEQLVAEIG